MIGYENIDRNIFFSHKKDSRNRGHEITLVKDQCRLDIRKYSFSQMTINEWNKLSTDCVTACSMNMFKTRLTHISGGRPTQMKIFWTCFVLPWMAILLNDSWM